MEELTPIFQEIVQAPVAFLGGFCAGFLRLDLAEEPVKGWLEKAGAMVVAEEKKEVEGNRPQTIEIE